MTYEKIFNYLQAVPNLRAFCRDTGLNYKTSYRIKTGATTQMREGSALLFGKAIEAYEKKLKRKEMKNG